MNTGPASARRASTSSIVRDYLETLDWNKKAPGPKLPQEVIRRTTAKYRQALDLLTRSD